MKYLLESANAPQQFPFFMPILLGVMMIAMYFFFGRSQSKQRKREEEMRNSLKIGDEVVTIGGIIGRVVNIRESSDEIIIETGSDRNKLKIKRWAVSSLCNAEQQNETNASK